MYRSDCWEGWDGSGRGGFEVVGSDSTGRPPFEGETEIETPPVHGRYRVNRPSWSSVLGLVGKVEIGNGGSQRFRTVGHTRDEL